ncbi:MAG TPA: serine hydrolase domain-containing protein, partial [Gemmatimonadales bacterium]
MRRGWIALVMGAGACARGTSPPAPVMLTKPITNWHPVMSYLDSVVAAGAAPGAVLGVTYRGERFVYGTGGLETGDTVRPGDSTVYDLASLTKVVALTPALMLAVGDGKVALDDPVQHYIPAFAGPDKEQVTVRMLLAHASGLPAWRPLFREVTTRAAAFALADSTPLAARPGTESVYSDLGAIVLTQLVETVYGQRIDSLVEQRLFTPLGLTSLRYLPPPSWRERIAPTEMDPWRGRMLRGEVHDENAAIMDGVSGHAGLFGSVDDLLTFAEWMLAQASGRSGGQSVGRSGASDRDHRPPDRPTVRPAVFAEFTQRQLNSDRALGWDMPSEGGSAGHLLSPSSIGHTGFTGTSLWIDPQHDVAIVLLSNRVHPTRNNPRWAPVRAAVSDLVMTTLFED